jgi:hypothetical protein
LRDRLGLDFEHLADFMRQVGNPPLGAVVIGLRPRGFLAGRRRGLERCPGVAVGFGLRMLRFGEAIGSVTVCAIAPLLRPLQAS